MRKVLVIAAGRSADADLIEGSRSDPQGERVEVTVVTPVERGNSPEADLGPYLPEFARGDLAAVAVGVVGMILAMIFFASGPGTQSGAGAAQGLIALGTVLISISQMIAIAIFEGVGYRGDAQRLVCTMTLVYAPLAALANLVILIAS